MIRTSFVYIAFLLKCSIASFEPLFFSLPIFLLGVHRCVYNPVWFCFELFSQKVVWLGVRFVIGFFRRFVWDRHFSCRTGWFINWCWNGVSPPVKLITNLFELRGVDVVFLVALSCPLCFTSGGYSSDLEWFIFLDIFAWYAYAGFFDTLDWYYSFMVGFEVDAKAARASAEVFSPLGIRVSSNRSNWSVILHKTER